jgi:hypothetical protein
MSKSAAASRHVVERCPRCGVEHDISADSICEACDTPLRAWCRTHGREFGWLDGEACPRCAAEAARPPAAPPVPPVTLRRPPAPSPIRPEPRPVPEPSFVPTAPGRPSREIRDDGGSVPGVTPGFGGMVKRLLGNLGVSVLFGVGATALLLSLIGFVSLLSNNEVTIPRHLRVLGFTLGFVLGLTALAVAVDAMRRWRG